MYSHKVTLLLSLLANRGDVLLLSAGGVTGGGQVCVYRQLECSCGPQLSSESTQRRHQTPRRHLR